jgi:hypothetical protein
MQAMTVGLLALSLPLQVPKEPAKDLFLHSAQVPGVEIRFVDYHWQPALFEAMETGKGDEPLAKRNWVVIRMILDAHPLTLEGKRLAVGNYGIALWPNLDGKGMQYEVRRVDMRDVFPDVNAIAPIPRGETYYKGPAVFEAAPLAERLAVEAAEVEGVMTLVLRYGPKRLALKFTR